MEDFIAPSLFGKSASAENSSESALQREWPAILRCLKNPRDREFLEVWATGEFRVGPFAKVLLIMDLALRQQRLKVKQAKDRLRTTLRRARRKLAWCAKL